MTNINIIIAVIVSLAVVTIIAEQLSVAMDDKSARDVVLQWEAAVIEYRRANCNVLVNGVTQTNLLDDGTLQSIPSPLLLFSLEFAPMSGEPRTVVQIAPDVVDIAAAQALLTSVLFETDGILISNAENTQNESIQYRHVTQEDVLRPAGLNVMLAFNEQTPTCEVL